MFERNSEIFALQQDSKEHSREENCWNNTITEFVFGSLKREMEDNYFYKF
ncbi:hypothetical protein LEP1GSC073_4395 [Leptospira noguchii str. Cascata]|nr:hypothetical protein LEP1GSC073_4395 [Leptospira noguchii str. Cascata]